MKRTILTIALTMVMSVAFISGAMAQQQTAPQPNAPMSSTPKAGAPEKFESFAGVISRVNVATKEVGVKKDDKEMTFSWGDMTKFKEGKKDLSFTDLKEGMTVAVQYKKEGDKYMAEKVNVKHAKSAGKKKSY